MLYVVSSPLGNLDDLSLRQAKTLLNSDIILAEDTRSALFLLDAIKQHYPYLLPTTNYQLQPKLISYYKEREFEKLPEIISHLKNGLNISLLSENGTPLVSDPGLLLVKTCIKERIPFTVIPGPSAVISAIVLSGFDPSQFMFLGFLPKKQSQILRQINKMESIKKIFPDMVFVFYESPKRIRETLQCFKTSKWNPDIAICREMTKKFEEVIRGKADNLIGREYKGEITVVVK